VRLNPGKVTRFYNPPPASRKYIGSMKTAFTATARITIKAKAAKVWDALTNPRIIKEYLFGTEAKSDWKVGSPITYSGVWEGKRYEDKGTILELVPNRRLSATYWSSFSSLPDLPENYSTVTYELSEARGETTLTVIQDNNPTRESADHSQGNWEKVLQTMKALLEK
jgi:uncharacterized protein YndB with AHSA1/START domain